MYVPGELPEVSPELEGLKRALEEELRKISESLKVGEFESINLQLLTSALDKNRSGDLINADGTNYDPGNGAGIYHFNGTIFNKLG
jgi:hypothetical protein